jgi:3-oxoadipate enol-lactonase
LVGLWLGAHAPERSHKLVLANTAAVIGTQATWDARIASVKEGGMAKIVEGVLERWFSARFRESDPDAVDRLRRILLATSGAGYIAACAAVRDADLRATAAKVRVPTLLITGEFDAATPPSGGRWLAERIAGARHVELEAAHLSNVEAESAFNESVLGFLSAQGETRHGRAAAT